YARPPHFAVHYRAGRRLRWTAGPRTDYAALLLLGGRLRWQSACEESESSDKESTATGEVAGGGALLAAPGDMLSATAGGAAEFLLITLAPLFVFDCAARARPTRPHS